MKELHSTPPPRGRKGVWLSQKGLPLDFAAASSPRTLVLHVPVPARRQESLAIFYSTKHRVGSLGIKGRCLIFESQDLSENIAREFEDKAKYLVHIYSCLAIRH